MAATERLAAADVPLADLRAHPRNPRTIRPERLEHLKRTLEAERGMLDARPLIALPDGTVVAGNQRLEAARQLGWETIPTVYADLTEEQQTRWMLLDNRPFGDDDETAVATLLQELEQAGSDLDLTGYTRQDTDRMLRELTRPERDPDEAPPVPAEPKSVRGEVYELGPHRLMCGDATDIADLDRLMDGDLADVVFTDPPYGVDYTGGTKERDRLEGDADPGIYERFLPHLADATKPTAAMYLFYADRHSVTVEQAVVAAGWQVRNHLVWHKVNAPFGTLGAQYKLRHEFFLYAHRRGKAPVWRGPNNEVTVWEHQRASRNDFHPTQKPVGLGERALANSSDRGGVVLDPFGGSGSTMIAAELAGRVALLMELEPAYCDVIRQRYADHTGQPQYAP